jgi:hydroxypyruvate isomerase
MDRRTFAQALAATALGAAAAPRLATASEGAAQAEAASATPFPLSVMLWTVFRDLPFEERLAKIKEAGYSNVELVGEYHGWDEAEFAKANAARKKLGIRFDATAGLKSGIGDPSLREMFLKELQEGLAPMETLECPAMIVLSGNKVAGLSHEEQHKSCVDGLKEAAKVIEGKQIGGEPVRLLLETIDPEENPKYFLTSMTEAIEAVRAVNHPQVQVLYDVFHEQIAEGNLIEKLEKNIDVIGLVHIADVPGRHEPGTGEINYMNIYRKLVELKYAKIAAMEFYPSGDPVATLRAAREEVARAAKM